MVSFITAFFGLGGGIIIVPILYELFPTIPHHTVVACSFFVVFLNSLINTYNFIKAGKTPQRSVALLLCPTVCIGVYIGIHISFFLSTSILKIIIATLLAAVIVRQLFSIPKDKSNKQWQMEITWLKGTILVITSLLSSIIAALTGLGGGIVLVPMLLLVAKAPPSWIPPQTNIALLCGSLLGIILLVLCEEQSLNPFIGHPFESLHIGHLNFGVILCIFAGSLLLSKHIIRLLSEKVSPVVIRRTFIVMMSVLFLRILYTI